MSPAEFVRVLTFVAAVGTVYVLAAVAFARWIQRRLGVPGEQKKPYQKYVDRTAVGLAFVGLLCGAYGYFVEPYWPEVSRVRIKTSKLPTGSRSIRIAQISDLHSDPTPRLEERLPDIIAQEKPDLILFTGDCINSTEGLPVFKRCLTRIAGIAPTFAVKGNWDTDFSRGLDLFGGTGAAELNGASVPVEAAGTTIWISGASAGNEPGVVRALDRVPAGAFTIFLYHYPDLIPEISARQVDLYCAGHTHGGQVALPLYGALVTLSKFGKRYESGLYRVDQTWLYVNRGIGMEGGGAPRVRFCARPEITIFDIVPSAGPGSSDGA